MSEANEQLRVSPISEASDESTAYTRLYEKCILEEHWCEAMFRKLGEDSKTITEMRRELDEFKKQKKETSSERFEFYLFGEPNKEEAIEEAQGRIEYFEEQHQLDKEAIELFENEADLIGTHRDEYCEWYSDSLNDYADEVHEAEEHEVARERFKVELTEAAASSSSSSSHPLLSSTRALRKESEKIMVPPRPKP